MLAGPRTIKCAQHQRRNIKSQEPEERKDKQTERSDGCWLDGGWWMEHVAAGWATSEPGCASVGKEIKVADLKPGPGSLSLSMRPQ